MKSKQNLVFKFFVVFCILMSAFVIYFLMIRPLKIVVSTTDITTDPIVFTYTELDSNPTVDEIIKRSEDGSRLIVVLLGPNRKLLANQTYEKVLAGFRACNNKLPCDVIKVQKSVFDERARDRKDKNQKPPLF